MLKVMVTGGEGEILGQNGEGESAGLWIVIIMELRRGCYTHSRGSATSHLTPTLNPSSFSSSAQNKISLPRSYPPPTA